MLTPYDFFKPSPISHQQRITTSTIPEVNHHRRSAHPPLAPTPENGLLPTRHRHPAGSHPPGHRGPASTRQPMQRCHAAVLAAAGADADAALVGRVGFRAGTAAETAAISGGIRTRARADAAGASGSGRVRRRRDGPGAADRPGVAVPPLLPGLVHGGHAGCEAGNLMLVGFFLGFVFWLCCLVLVLWSLVVCF